MSISRIAVAMVALTLTFPATRLIAQTSAGPSKQDKVQTKAVKTQPAANPSKSQKPANSISEASVLGVKTSNSPQQKPTNAISEASVTGLKSEPGSAQV